jgi:hypothetical protein
VCGSENRGVRDIELWFVSAASKMCAISGEDVDVWTRCVKVRVGV